MRIFRFGQAGYLALLLLFAPLRPGHAQDPRFYHWVTFSGKNLHADESGVRIREPVEHEGEYWRFLPNGNSGYEITNAGNPRLRLVVKNGKPVMALQGETLWRVRSGRLIYGEKSLVVREDKLALSTAGDSDPGATWFFWPRRRVGSPPPAQGNYYRNDGPVRAQEPRGIKSAGALWRVIGTGLRLRAKPDPRAKVLYTFPAGTVLQADVGYGGSDEVLWNASDDQGNTWMRARTGDGKDLNGYVRANRRYIRPVSPGESTLTSPAGPARGK